MLVNASPSLRISMVPVSGLIRPFLPINPRHSPRFSSKLSRLPRGTHLAEGIGRILNFEFWILNEEEPPG
jgi:hypothetical protein